MSTTRILAMFRRHYYILIHSIDQMVSTFFWSFLDVFLWGFTSIYLRNINNDLEKITVVLLSGLILWLTLNRASYEIGIALMEEIWNQNLINIFSSPLKFSEWIISALLMGLFKITIAVGLASLMAYILYAANIYSLGFYLIPFVFNLVIFGWAIGFITAGLVLRYGTSIQALVWTGIFLIMPFSAVYYPVAVLPEFGQVVSRMIPASYVFEGMRSVLYHQTFMSEPFIFATGLNLLYLTVSVLFLYWLFNVSKEKGLGRLE